MPLVLAWKRFDERLRRLDAVFCKRPSTSIARRVLVDFWGEHPEAKVSLERWYVLVRAARWTSTDDVRKSAPNAKVLNRERVSC